MTGGADQGVARHHPQAADRGHLHRPLQVRQESLDGRALLVMLPLPDAAHRSTSFCEPIRQGTHLPHDSLRKNFEAFRPGRACHAVAVDDTSARPEHQAHVAHRLEVELQVEDVEFRLARPAGARSRREPGREASASGSGQTARKEAAGRARSRERLELLAVAHAPGMILDQLSAGSCRRGPRRRPAGCTSPLIEKNRTLAVACASDPVVAIPGAAVDRRSTGPRRRSRRC